MNKLNLLRNVLGCILVVSSLHEAKSQITNVAAKAASPLPEIGFHHHIVYTTKIGTDDDGNVTTNSGSYTTLATGMHYLDDKGQWQDSVPVFDVLPVGAVAQRTAHKVILAASPVVDNPVDVLMPDGERMVSKVFGLSYYDTISGKSVLIAEPQDVAGQLQPSKSDVVYLDAFTPNGTADLAYHLTLAGLEQDVILRSQLPDPGDYGLDPNSTRIEVVTEFTQTPVPKITTRIVSQETDVIMRAQMMEPDFVDQFLEFGSMVMGAGKAFSLPNAPVIDFPPAASSIPVNKEWQVINGRTFLFESVPYSHVKPLLDDLPAAPQAGKRANPDGKVAVSRAQLLEPRSRGLKSTNVVLVAQQKSAGIKGLVLDYTLVSTTSASFTFLATNTYYVNGLAVFSGYVSFEGGAVIKFTNANASAASIKLLGGVFAVNPILRPVIFTAQDDYSVGEPVAPAGASPSGYYGDAMLYYANASQPLYLDNVQFRYAKTGCRIDSSTNNLLRNIQFSKCGTGVEFVQTSCLLHNVLDYDTQNAFSATNSTVTGEHLTVHRATSFINFDTNSTFTAKNSLFVTVTNMSNFVPDGSNRVLTNDTGVFQVVGSGAHYLSAGSPYRGVATNIIDTTLLADLRLKTTYPPQVMTNSVTTNTVWGTQVPRDTGTLIDLGFHYPVLDYAVSQCVVTNATLLITNSVQVGVFGDFGFQPHHGSKISAEGSPATITHPTGYMYTKFVRFVRTDQSQEGANLSWAGTTNSSVIRRIFKEKWTTSGAIKPEVSLRLVEIPLMAGGGARFTGGDQMGRISLYDCHISSADFFAFPDNYYDLTLAITNSVFARVNLTYGSTTNSNNLISYMRNCLMSSCNMTLNPSVSNKWEWRDNFFLVCDFFTNTYVFTNSHNAYIGGSPFPGSLGGDVVDFSIDFSSGPFGGLYHSSPCILTDAGSRSASAAGLYHYTTDILQVKEANTIVDIGFHFIATSSLFDPNPVDTDGDGIPDYLEDRNGNGFFDPALGESNWQTGISSNGLTGTNGIQVFTPLK